MFVVTGANGFIGSAMVWELNRRGHRDILAVDRVSPEARPDLLRSLAYDRFMTDQEFLEFLKAKNALNIRAVFHMGACSSTTEMDTEFLRRVNTEYTQRLFEAARESGYPLLYASSGAVYGNGDLGFGDEGSSEKFKPLNPYGWSKAHFDVWAERQPATANRWYGLRFFNVYGPNEYHKGDMASVVFKAVNQIKANGRLRLFRSHRPDYQDGQQLRDFVYVKDITSWMWNLFENSKVRSGIYNMGFGKARTWLDLADSVFKNLGKPTRIDWIDMPDSVKNQYQYFTEAKMNKLLSEGLPEPKWSLEEGIADYVTQYLVQENPYLVS